MPKKIDLTGQPFGRLIVIREYGRDKNGAVLWLCRCLGKNGDDCGKEVVVRGDSLRNGNTRSCGCLHDEKSAARFTTHGLTIDHKRLLKSITSHIGMIRSPYSVGHKYYKHLRIPAKYLGASGLERFVREVVKRYPKEAEEYERNKSLELDKDISGESVFTPCNIRFVTAKENRSCRKNTIRLDDGTPLAMFCSSIGIKTCEKGCVPTPKYLKILKTWRRHKIHPELMQALDDDTKKEERLLEMTKLKIRHTELMITGLKELLASKSDTLDTRTS